MCHLFFPQWVEMLPGKRDGKRLPMPAKRSMNVVTYNIDDKRCEDMINTIIKGLETRHEKVELERKLQLLRTATVDWQGTKTIRLD